MSVFISAPSITRQFSFSAVLILTLSLLSLSAVHADEKAPDYVLLGAGVWSRPAYDGSADSQVMAPIPSVRYYGPVLFARTTMGVLEGGARRAVGGGLTLGAQLAYEGGRTSAESSFLSSRNLPDLPPSVSWGAHVEWDRDLGPAPVTLLLRWRQDLRTERGAQTDLRLNVGVFSGAGLNAGVFAQRTWADARATQYAYGLDAQQAAVSGLAAYAPQGGALYDAAGLIWSYDLSPRWLLLGSLEGRRLRGDALGSPLTQTEGSRYGSLSLAYRF